MSPNSNYPSRLGLVWAVAGMLQLNVLSISANELSSRERNDKNQRMLEQKMALVERIVFKSPLGEQAKNHPVELSIEAFKAWELASRAYEKAVEQFNHDDGSTVNDALDSALSFYRQASSIQQRSGSAKTKLAGVLPELRNRINGYQESLAGIANEKGVHVSANVDSKQVQGTLSAAQALENHGDIEGAVQLLQVLQSELENELVQIRSGETVITHLKLDNIEDAFEYELKRNVSNGRLLDLLLKRSHLSDGTRKLFEQYLQQSRDASLDALRHRDAGELKPALRTLQNSTELQTRAFRILGINI